MSQSLSQQLIHIVFSTKNRKPYFRNPVILKRTEHYIKQICDNAQCPLIAIGGAQDHVHALVNLNKNISLSSLIENVKKSTSRWLKTLTDVDPTLEQFYWQRGYGAFSVSQSNIEKTKEYILNQAVHHQKMSFQDELRAILIRHRIKFDEMYLWD